ncbi:hypothetical protein FGO68_gene17330 [Halteria grandinella]|uniref:Uncharacterized protein n=1 Tax=Halteria grandinella TaxID=5974 RepID=A0A8J8NBY1_HALGN|nr:hypothetical protein FGO68_gene17330 [Halteria grandinella]
MFCIVMRILTGNRVGLVNTNFLAAALPSKPYQQTICPLVTPPSRIGCPRELQTYICTVSPDSQTKRAMPVLMSTSQVLQGFKVMAEVKPRSLKFWVSKSVEVQSKQLGRCVASWALMWRAPRKRRSNQPCKNILQLF